MSGMGFYLTRHTGELCIEARKSVRYQSLAAQYNFTSADVETLGAIVVEV